jgi:hypothetical protein
MVGPATIAKPKAYEGKPSGIKRHLQHLGGGFSIDAAETLLKSGM